MVYKNKEAEHFGPNKCEKQTLTIMWANAQRDGRPAEHKWHPLRKFGNSIPCTTPRQSLADARCWTAVH